MATIGKNGANCPKPKDTSGRGIIKVMITFSLEIKSLAVSSKAINLKN
jgi:hypothetical protein